MEWLFLISLTLESLSLSVSVVKPSVQFGDFKREAYFSVLSQKELVVILT